MQRFKVNISPGVSQVVEAENSAEARQKVKAQIAKGAMSPFYDKLYFDYDTGVNVKGLRSSLGRAETDKEKDLGEELADVVFVAMCLANQTGVDLSAAFEKKLNHKTERDHERHHRNPKLKP